MRTRCPAPVSPDAASKAATPVSGLDPSSQVGLGSWGKSLSGCLLLVELPFGLSPLACSSAGARYLPFAI